MTITFITGLECFAAGLLGIAFHVFAIKIPSVKTRSNVANVPFNYSQYFTDDLAAIISSVLAVLICCVVLPEIVAYKPDIAPYLKIGFVFIGYSGASIIIAVMGQFQTKLNGIVDMKTNISDNIPSPQSGTFTPPPNSTGSPLPPIPPTTS